MWWDWLGSFHKIQIANIVDEPAIFSAHDSFVLWRQEAMRKADLEAVRVIDLVQLLFVEPEAKRFDVSLEMLDFAAAYNRVDIRASGDC